MSRITGRKIGLGVASAFILFSVQNQSYAFSGPQDLSKGAANSFIVEVKKPRCSAGTVESYEGTDMSGIKRACQARFDACVDESSPCNVRLKNCREFEKMEKNKTCYK